MTNQGRAARRQILGRESTTEGTQERMKDHNESLIVLKFGRPEASPLAGSLQARGARGTTMNQ